MESSTLKQMNGKRFLKDYSLYIHLPFCSKKCDYCHFFVLPDKEIYKSQLLDGLKKEWDLVNSKTRNMKLVSIYFGGGTPSLFSPDRIHELLSLWDHGDIEVTLEANPELVTDGLMKDYAQAGINRVSLGVQSFDDQLLKQLSRTHGSQTAVKAIECISKSIQNISIDMMYDIPTQKLAQWERTLTQAVELPITHVSLYNLTFEPHTVFYKYRDKLQKTVPNEETSQEMYELAVEKLTAQNFKQYEISAFCQLGYESQHNSGYWTGRPFIGLGPSAFSYWEGSRYRNVANLNKYLRALEDGKTPEDYRETLEPDAAQRELFVIALRLMRGVKIQKSSSLYEETIQQLISQGLLKLRSDRLKLTPLGILHYETVAAELI
ncbi:MAG: Oxygen-independent coproporphyrinogen-III oxidase-like protein [Chlamydiae bacterium]|nr:Oxygen-independent coproporphyrinogen-III oxidase-like protein [Chlamydiota bacterium]